MTVKDKLKLANLPFLKPNTVQFREYQVSIAKQCSTVNSLVVIPTGLGKTIIAVLVVVHALQSYPKGSKVVVCAPTRPLIDQHYQTFKQLFQHSEDAFAILTGRTSSTQRISSFWGSQFLFFTPQTLRNDLLANRYTLRSTCILILDEAHHASGDYPYRYLADAFTEQNPDGLILGLTASPGSSKTRIQELCSSLHIEPSNVHIRDRKDEDVKHYLNPMQLFKVGVTLTELMKDAYRIITTLLEERLRYLIQFNFLGPKLNLLHEQYFRTDLLKLNKTLVSRLHDLDDKTHVYSALSITAQALILYHMAELVEQQGLEVLYLFLIKFFKDARKSNSSKAHRILASDYRVIRMFNILQQYRMESPDALVHPKFNALEAILTDQVKQQPDSRILVFVKFRDSVQNIVGKLQNNKLLKPQRFVGQATKSRNDKGLSQKVQLAILEDFKKGDYNVLVSTNVAEEGLDIVECDVVVFFDVVASEIRYIQRRGRTARHREGRVIILYSKDTHDELYLSIALHKLKKMRKCLSQPTEIEPSTEQRQVKGSKQEVTTLFDFLSKDLMSSNRQSILHVSSDFPVKFGVRKVLQQEGIGYELDDSHQLISLPRKITIRMSTLEDVKQGIPLPLKVELIKLRKDHEVVILAVDREYYEESIEGEMRVLQRIIYEQAENIKITCIPLDNPEEFIFILKNITSQIIT